MGYCSGIQELIYRVNLKNIFKKNTTKAPLWKTKRCLKAKGFIINRMPEKISFQHSFNRCRLKNKLILYICALN
jgi:hypothetical protein